MNLRVPFALSLGALLAAGPLAAQGSQVRVLSVYRRDTLAMADSARGQVRPAAGNFLVLQVEVQTPDLDSDLTGDVTLTGTGLPHALELRGVATESELRLRTTFLRIIENRGGGFITATGHVHWVNSRTGRARVEAYGRVTFGLVFEVGDAAGPFVLNFGAVRVDLQPPVVMGAP